jgi:hypothetical protein
MKRTQILLVLTMAALLSMFELACAAEKKGLFTLVRGRRVDVCEAYLTRVNAVQFEDAAFCDRPEDASVPGFTALNRVSLTPEEVFKLWPSVSAMEKPVANTSEWTLEAARQELGRTILAWKYEPNVDIQNNGSSETVIMWRGSRIRWGIETSDFACGFWDRRDPQVAFILSAFQGQVDEVTTKRVFWRAKSEIHSNTINGKRQQQFIDRPIGWHMSIFEFKGLYYFDTFYEDDGWGDYQNNRRKDKTLKNTLAVFLNRHGVTREMCELRLN